MEREKEKGKSKTTATYQGKKLYYVNPLIAKKIPTPEKVPDYREEELERKNKSKDYNL